MRTLQYEEQDLEGESGLSLWPWLDKGVLAAIALFGVVVLLALISAPHFFCPPKTLSFCISTAITSHTTAQLPTMPAAHTQKVRRTSRGWFSLQSQYGLA